MCPSNKGYVISDQYATYFLTFTIVGWVDIFTRKEIKYIVIDSLKYCQNNKGLTIYSYVIMSNHIHLIARASQESTGLSDIIRDFKKFTSKKIMEFIKNDKRESRKDWIKLIVCYHAKFNKNNKNFQVWQQYNKPKILLHPKFSQKILNYIHENPIRAGIVDQASDYIYSSARNYAGDQNIVLQVEILDFGVTEGYLMIDF